MVYLAAVRRFAALARPSRAVAAERYIELLAELLDDIQATAAELKHTTLATARLRFLFVAAKIVRHARAVLVRYSDHYAEQGTLTRLMNRLRSIVPAKQLAPVVPTPLRV